jgi:hypothetical protein
VKTEEDEECLYCGSTYLSSKQGEDLACCKQCFPWVHENCAGIGEGDDFICDLCT